jgi:hypothetical protein
MCWPATCTPALVVSGRGPDRLRLPCFHFGPAVGVLPAFGDFTGLHVMPRGPATASCVVGSDSLRALTLGRMKLPPVEHLLVRAESPAGRLEAILPHAATAPDWSASVAFRYRKRGAGVLEPVRHVATIRLADLKEVDRRRSACCATPAQFVAGQGRPTTCC